MIKLAKKRMFSIEVVESDAFCVLPSTAQNLYFHLCMNADDDGFVDKWKGIYSLDVLLGLFGISLLFHGQF